MNVTSECPRPFSSLGGLLSGEGRGGKKERKPDFTRRERGGTRHERDEREGEICARRRFLPLPTYLHVRIYPGQPDLPHHGTELFILPLLSRIACLDSSSRWHSTKVNARCMTIAALMVEIYAVDVSKRECKSRGTC